MTNDTKKQTWKCLDCDTELEEIQYGPPRMDPDYIKSTPQALCKPCYLKRARGHGWNKMADEMEAKS
jgi:uncharacterized protein with PIN domain